MRRWRTAPLLLAAASLAADIVVQHEANRGATKCSGRLRDAGPRQANRARLGARNGHRYTSPPLGPPMLNDYVPILLLLGIALGFALLNNVLSEWLGRRRVNVGKRDPYECGMEPRGSARIRLSIHFYL